MMPTDFATQYQLDHALQPWFFLLKRAEQTGIANQKRWESLVTHEREKLTSSIETLIPNALIAEETLQLFDRWQTHILYGNIATNPSAISLIDLDFAENFWSLIQGLPETARWSLHHVLLQLINSWMNQPIQDDTRAHLQLLCGKIQRVLQQTPKPFSTGQESTKNRLLKSYINNILGLFLIVFISMKMPHWVARHYPILVAQQTTETVHHA